MYIKLLRCTTCNLWNIYYSLFDEVSLAYNTNNVNCCVFKYQLFNIQSINDMICMVPVFTIKTCSSLSAFYLSVQCAKIIYMTEYMLCVCLSVCILYHIHLVAFYATPTCSILCYTHKKTMNKQYSIKVDVIQGDFNVNTNKKKLSIIY